MHATLYKNSQHQTCVHSGTTCIAARDYLINMKFVSLNNWFPYFKGGFVVFYVAARLGQCSTEIVSRNQYAGLETLDCPGNWPHVHLIVLIHVIELEVICMLGNGRDRYWALERFHDDDLYQIHRYVTTEEICWFGKKENTMAGGFRANIFDPLLIVAQIVAMQCSFYAFMGLWILLADVIGGIQPSVEQVLDYRVSVHQCA